MINKILMAAVVATAVTSGSAIAGEHCIAYFTRTNTRVIQLSAEGAYYLSWNNGPYQFCGSDLSQDFTCADKNFSRFAKYIYDQTGTPYLIETKSLKPAFTCSRGSDGAYTSTKETKIIGKIVGSNTPISFLEKITEKYKAITPSF